MKRKTVPRASKTKQIPLTQGRLACTRVVSDKLSATKTTQRPRHSRSPLGLCD
jgi:hypothetical protein